MESSLITAGLLGSIITVITQALLNNWFEGVKNRREIRKLVFQRKTEIVEKAILLKKLCCAIKMLLMLI